MRVLQVIPSLSLGGAEKIVVELANSLSTSGHHVDILLVSNCIDNTKFSLNNNITISSITNQKKFHFLAYLSGFFWIIKNLNNLKKYDAIHCHLTFGLIFGFYLYFFLKKPRSLSRKPKLIYTFHGVGAPINYVILKLNKKLAYFFDNFVLMAIDDMWRNLIIEKKNICVIRNGIKIEKLLCEEKTKRIQGKTVIGTISRLEKERIPAIYLEIFSEILKVFQGELMLIIGGAGSLQKMLSNKIKNNGLDGQIILTGEVRNLQGFMDTIDVYITLTVEDTPGVSGLEAVLSGVPVFGIQLCKNYKASSNDWIWSSNNTRELAQFISEYLKNITALDLLARKQRKYASKYFSIEKMMTSYLDLY